MFWTNLIKFMFCFCVFALVLVCCVFPCACLPPNTLLPRNPPSALARTLTTSSPLRLTWPITIATNEQQIITKSVVKVDTLEDTCIPNVFKERMWTKLMNPSGNVYLEIIKEFFSNASVDGDHINC